MKNEVIESETSPKIGKIQEFDFWNFFAILSNKIAKISIKTSATWLI